MKRLMLLGLNHSTAPLEVREKIAFAPAQRDEAVASFRAKFPETEIILVSTCNRVEIYASRKVHGKPRIEEIIAFLGEFHAIDPASFSSHLYQKTGTEVVNHLFTVTSSLDSMVLGETQILGQVREAYDAAKAQGAAGPMLNPLFQRAIAVGKEVLSATAISEGRLSVASVAVDYARRIFDHFGDKTVLSIGAGKMAHLVLQSFAQLKPGKLLVCNRTQEKAEELASEFGAQAVPFENLGEHLTAADIVVSSTGAHQPIISKALVSGLRKAMRYRPIFLIDIALPRDIESTVGDLENVYLYNIDDLQQVVAGTLSQRREAIDAATGIVSKHVEEFLDWQRTRELGPLINRLSQRYHQLAAEELQRTLHKLPNISGHERAHLEDLTRRIAGKLLHDPISMLRASTCMHGPSAQFMRALEELFKIDDDAAAEAEEEVSGGAEVSRGEGT